jgi:hypothetical protein
MLLLLSCHSATVLKGKRPEGSFKCLVIPGMTFWKFVKVQFHSKGEKQPLPMCSHCLMRLAVCTCHALLETWSSPQPYDLSMGYRSFCRWAGHLCWISVTLDLDLVHLRLRCVWLRIQMDWCLKLRIVGDLHFKPTWLPWYHLEKHVWSSGIASVSSQVGYEFPRKCKHYM